MDIELTEKLKEALFLLDAPESDEELGRITQVLLKVKKLAKQWIKELAMQKNMSPSAVEHVGGEVYPFGSYLLGVHQKGAVIDTLCIAPRHVNRSDYFTSFAELLTKQYEVSELQAVHEASEPYIKFKFEGIKFNMQFARLALNKIPDNIDLRDDMLLENLDAECVRCLNGRRVTDEILRLVPNADNFRLTLRAIKLWARKQGIYNNVLGYLGNESWAILVALICQLDPNARAATLIHHFFLIFCKWPWPEPVILKPIDRVNLNFSVWDPRVNTSDHSHLMPIVTPAYPQQNSARNVSRSTLTVIQDKFIQGFSTVEEIVTGEATWAKLFEPPGFFKRYKHFLVITASSANNADQLELVCLIESKIHHLISSLEQKDSITLAHINPEQFDPVYSKPNSVNTLWFIGLDFKICGSLTIDFREDFQLFIAQAQGVNSDKIREDWRVNVKYVKRKQLGEYLHPNVLQRQGDVTSTPSDGSSSSFLVDDRHFSSTSLQTNGAISATDAVGNE